MRNTWPSPHKLGERTQSISSAHNTNDFGVSKAADWSSFSGIILKAPSNQIGYDLLEPQIESFERRQGKIG